MPLPTHEGKEYCTSVLNDVHELASIILTIASWEWLCLETLLTRKKRSSFILKRTWLMHMCVSAIPALASPAQCLNKCWVQRAFDYSDTRFLYRSNVSPCWRLLTDLILWGNGNSQFVAILTWALLLLQMDVICSGTIVTCLKFLTIYPRLTMMPIEGVGLAELISKLMPALMPLRTHCFSETTKICFSMVLRIRIHDKLAKLQALKSMQRTPRWWLVSSVSLLQYKCLGHLHFVFSSDAFCSIVIYWSGHLTFLKNVSCVILEICTYTEMSACNSPLLSIYFASLI